jgi:exonuclease III
MRVISWNMRRATADSAAWSYFDQLDPDVALLQEVNGVPAAIQKRFTTLHQPARGETGNDQKFGTAVLVRGERVGDLNLTSPHE